VTAMRGNRCSSKLLWWETVPWAKRELTEPRHAVPLYRPISSGGCASQSCQEGPPTVANRQPKWVEWVGRSRANTASTL